MTVAVSVVNRWARHRSRISGWVLPDKRRNAYGHSIDCRRGEWQSGVTMTAEASPPLSAFWRCRRSGRAAANCGEKRCRERACSGQTSLRGDRPRGGVYRLNWVHGARAGLPRSRPSRMHVKPGEPEKELTACSFGLRCGVLRRAAVAKLAKIGVGGVLLAVNLALHRRKVDGGVYRLICSERHRRPRVGGAMFGDYKRTRFVPLRRISPPPGLKAGRRRNAVQEGAASVHVVAKHRSAGTGPAVAFTVQICPTAVIANRILSRAACFTDPDEPGGVVMSLAAPI